MKYYEVNFSISTPSDSLSDDVRDVVAALAGEAGFETFEETEQGLRGYVQQSLFDEEALKAQLQLLPFDGAQVSYTITEAEHRDWNEVWEEQGFEPICVGSRIIIHDGRHLPLANSDELLIEINARMAFGTGNHATTRLMGEAIATQPLDGCTVLDCGTGTGILAIIALKCGAVKAVGYDIDQWSVENAIHNATVNQVADRFSVLQGDATLLKTIDSTFDLITANIHRNILLADMPAICKKLKPGGKLLLSGFYTADIPMLSQRAATFGLTTTAVSEEQSWACMTLETIGQ